MTKPKPPAVICYEEVVTVRGTLDPMEAVRVAVADEHTGWAEILTPADFPTITGLKTFLNQRVAQATTGWMRVVPGCPEWCGEGHTFHVHPATPGARGAFRAVWWDR